MKIRHRITLWVTGTGVLASLVFSLIVFVEMKELPYRSIDASLQVIGEMLGQMAIAGKINAGGEARKDLPFNTDLYWIRVYNGNMQVIYQTQLARYVSLPMRNSKGAYTVTAFVPEKIKGIRQDDNRVSFRLRIINVGQSALHYIIQIGKPVGRLQDEVSDLLQGIAVGLLVATLLLVGFGYTAAGRILKPIGVINRLARDISEKTLDQRIPLERSRDELYALSNSLNHMFDRLQYSFDVQKQFIANASHELKSPITLLMLFMEESVGREDLPESFRQRMIRQTNILRRMSRLVKNLLDLSALELKKKLDLQGVNLSEPLKSVLEDYEDVLNAKKINITVDVPERLQVRGDRDELQRVLINLMDNAIKYTHEGGEIRITAAKNDRGALISLFNTGIGIPKGELDKVFEQFYRVEKSRSLQYGGSGLGLTIVKRIMELHGGKVILESEEGAWTQVTLWFPVL